MKNTAWRWALVKRPLKCSKLDIWILLRFSMNRGPIYLEYLILMQCAVINWQKDKLGYEAPWIDPHPTSHGHVHMLQIKLASNVSVNSYCSDSANVNFSHLVRKKVRIKHKQDIVKMDKRNSDSKKGPGILQVLLIDLIILPPLMLLLIDWTIPSNIDPEEFK